MKRFMTETFFVPLKVSEELGMMSVKNKDGKEKRFKTRKAVEKYYYRTMNLGNISQCRLIPFIDLDIHEDGYCSYYQQTE